MSHRPICDEVTGVLLAGGKSRRLGEDKRFVTVGSTTLLDRCRSNLLATFAEVLIVTAQDSTPLDEQGCRVHQDLIPECGSLGGLYTGLYHASCERIFVAACDMPFLNERMIRLFIERDPEADVVMARLPHGLQPLHAVYSKAVLPALEQRARLRQLRIQDLVDEPSLKVTYVTEKEWVQIDPSSKTFYNVNTPADLAAARDELARASREP